MDLTDWKKKIELAVQSVQTSKSENKPFTYFSISTTTKLSENKSPFLTPLRQLEDGTVVGTVVFSQHQAEVACELVDGLVDYILIDVEKKLPITFEASASDAERAAQAKKSIDYFEMGNLSSVARQTVKKSKLIGYKPNDITVEAAWHLSNVLINDLSGKKVSVIGCGNIGFKLAMKYVESGASVVINRRDMTRGMMMADLINVNKPPTTLAHAHYESDTLKSCLFADLLIAASSGGAIVTVEMLKVLRPNALILDIGKGSLHPDALDYCFKHNLRVYRCDISSALYGYLATLRNTQNLIENQMGRTELTDGVFAVSGGAIGRKGDFVVDHHKNPKIVFGIANGEGEMIRNSTAPGFKDSIEKLKKAGIELNYTFSKE